MKKFTFLLFVAFIFITYPKALFAETTENQILIRTLDNSEAINLFRQRVNEDGGMLSRNGFGTNSYIGTPFSMEYQYGKPYEYLFYFPIIRDGKIVNYVEQTVWDNGDFTWAVTQFFGNEPDVGLMHLNDGNVYSLVANSKMDRLGVSDNGDVVEFVSFNPIEYDKPYVGKETTVVNILEPLDIDTSSIVPQTDEERAIIENARENGEFLLTQNIDSIGAINKDDRLLVPFRTVAELIECTVDWDGSEKAAYATKGDNVVKFVIGKSEYSINDETYDFDVPAEIYNDRTYIPLRAVSEALGANVTYNSASKMITLSYKRQI